MPSVQSTSIFSDIGIYPTYYKGNTIFLIFICESTDTFIKKNIQQAISIL